MKRKLFVAALVLILALAMLPSFALADGPLDQLKADIAAAPANGTETRVELTGNITDFKTDDIITIQEGQNIVLDMNGYSITVADDFSGRPLVNNGTLTMTGNGTIDSSDSMYGGLGAINNYGTLTIENGTYKGHIYANGAALYNRAGGTATINDGNFWGCAAVNSDGVITVNGGTFETTSCNQTVDPTGKKHWAYCFISSGTLYFNDGNVTGVQGGLAINNGYAEVKGGTFKTTTCEHTPNGSASYYALYIAGEEGEVEAHISGGTYTSAYQVAVLCGNDNPGGDGGINAKATAYISGGTFTGGTGVKGQALSAGKNTGDPLITGGTFSSDVSTYVSKSAAISTDSGKTVVTLKPSDNAVASVVKNGQTLYYTSLNDAVAEARDGETVEVLESTTISSALEIKNNITIDGNGNTVTADKCVGLYIKADLSKLTVTDLTLKGVLPEGSLAGEGGTGSFMGIGTYNGCYGVGDLQLTNVTVDGFSYGLYFGKNPAGGNGPYNENPVSVTANNLTVQNCYIKGAYFEKLTDSTFTSCKFLNNGTDETKVESGFRTWMCGVDINLKNGSYKSITFVGCTFTNNGANSGTALLIKARDDGKYGETTSLDGATVSGCTFTNNHGTTPVVIGEPGKVNKTPVNVSIQSDVKYTNNVAAASNFTVTFSSNGGTEYATQLVEADSEIILPTPSKSGYIFLGWRCGEDTYSAGATVKVTADMAFSAVWGNLPDVKPDTTLDEPVVTEFPFYDVAASAWYYDAVKYVYSKGLMDGVDTHEFAPNATLTRAMVWTILARAEGVDTTGGSTWYAKAQEWVVAKGVSDGENPNAAITRQELVTMLYRLAGSPTVTGSLTAPDASSVSSWAKDAMLWAMNLGLVEGDENGAVTPTATATRAQAAALIMRYTAK